MQVNTSGIYHVLFNGKEVYRYLKKKGCDMKKVFYFLLLFFQWTNLICSQNYTLPSLSLMNSNGQKINASRLSCDGHPMLMVFWNTGNNDCLKQVDALLSVRDEFLKEEAVKVIGIFVVSSGAWEQVLPLVSGKRWEMELYFDVNSELSRALCVPQLPFTILYDPKMKVVCSHTGYCTGMDGLLCRKIRECLSEMK